MADVNIVSGGVDNGDIKLYQQGLFLIPGVTYHVNFKAKSSVPRTLTVSVNTADNPQTSVWSQPVSLDTSLQKFGEFSFVFKGNSTLACQLSFLAGGDNSSVFIDDVELRAENWPYQLRSLPLQHKVGLSIMSIM